MAIIIPSKKTYERQNPKVRDNVIERIEVSAKEVVPDNEYETPVHNCSFQGSGNAENAIEKIKSMGLVINPSAAILAYQQTILQTKVIPYYTNVTIKFGLVKDNHRIIAVFDGLKKGTDEKNIGYSLTGLRLKQKVTALATGRGVDSGATVNIGEYKYGETEINQLGVFLIEKDIINEKELQVVTTVTADANITLDEGNISTAKGNLDESKNEYSITLRVLSSAEIYTLSAEPFTNTSSDPSFEVTLSGYYEKKIAEKVEFTFYGDTIGIDLTDNTVYINGQTAKKVQSIDGNELMQTSNYWLETGENAIKRAFFATQQEYANGKETATLRCSIGEYYGDKEFSVRFGGELSSYEDTAVYELFVSGDQKLAEGDIVYFKNHAVVITEVDEDYYAVVGRKDILSMYKGQSVVAKQLKISTKEKGVPMLFSEYDQVIPMKLGADGKDHPMSVYRDGTPKVFNVLSVHPYFDGAVWQELELQEIMKKV